MIGNLAVPFGYYRYRRLKAEENFWPEGTWYCGGRKISIPLMGEYQFWVTAVVDPTAGNRDIGLAKFGFRIDRDLHVSWCATVLPAATATARQAAAL